MIKLIIGVILRQKHRYHFQYMALRDKSALERNNRYLERDKPLRERDKSTFEHDKKTAPGKTPPQHSLLTTYLLL